MPALAENDPAAPRTMREQLERHRASPTCAACHKLMDPIGFALENFDAVGAWRASESGARLDTRDVLADGTPVDGVDGLRAALAARPDVFVHTFVEKLMTYALGRGLTAGRHARGARDRPRRAARGGYRFSAIAPGIARSVPFRMRTTTRADATLETRTGATPGPHGRS